MNNENDTKDYDDFGPPSPSETFWTALGGFPVTKTAGVSYLAEDKLHPILHLDDAAIRERYYQVLDGRSHPAPEKITAVTDASGPVEYVSAPEKGVEPTERVAHPKHYNSLGASCQACGHPIECIDVAEHFSFSLGSVLKYLWRAGLKDDELEDLEKMAWYAARALEAARKRLKGETT